MASTSPKSDRSAGNIRTRQRFEPAQTEEPDETGDAVETMTAAEEGARLD